MRRLPIAGDVVGALLSVPVGVVLMLGSAFTHHRDGGDEGGFLTGALAMTGLFAADAVAGAFAVSDCSDAKQEWRIHIYQLETFGVFHRHLFLGMTLQEEECINTIMLQMEKYILGNQTKQQYRQKLGYLGEIVVRINVF